MAWYVVDAYKSVCSWRKIVENSAELLYIESSACFVARNRVSDWFPVNVGY